MDSQDTLPNMQTILDAINGLRQEMNTKIDGLQQEMNAKFSVAEYHLNHLNQRLKVVEFEVGEIKNHNVSFDARLDRMQASAFETLQLAYSIRADITILRAEVTSWSKDVAELQLKVA